MTGGGRFELLSPALREAVVEAAGGHVLADIDRMFRSERFSLPLDFVPTQGSMRRSAAAAYDATVDFTSIAQVERYLRVVERLIDKLSETRDSTGHPWAASHIKRIQRELSRAGVAIAADGRLG